jgi:hypothetical protein
LEAEIKVTQSCAKEARKNVVAWLRGRVEAMKKENERESGQSLGACEKMIVIRLEKSSAENRKEN